LEQGTMKCRQTIALWVVIALTPALAAAQAPPAAQAPAAPSSATPAPDADPDARVDALQPDFTLVALPTTLRMPRHKLAFRVTHRFGRPLGQGDFGDLISDFFGFDSGAQIGLELRYGLARGTQIGVHRTSERTTQLFGQHNFLSERNGKRIGLDAFATLEGANNLRDRYQSALGVVVSHNAGRRAALYAEPFYVVNTNSSTGQGSNNNTLMVGLGARARLRPTMYVVGEITPRLTGYDPGVSQISFGLEGRAGGHQFQINVSNGAGTTLGQIASGANNNDNWYIGFNLSRKFF
jgi:uncharacterized beta barrel domain-containing protein DUF5777